jgi:hypothetical protein
MIFFYNVWSILHFNLLLPVTKLADIGTPVAGDTLLLLNRGHWNYARRQVLEKNWTKSLVKVTCFTVVILQCCINIPSNVLNISTK